ncbi:hypothetical protein [Roseateles sp.]|uniref:hypothetical protein n=1 Tax=Roseateles sp. TaxID=1971397 RepID=UPI0039519C62
MRIRSFGRCLVGALLLLGAVWSSWRFTDGRAVRATVTDEPRTASSAPEPAVSAAASALLTAPSALDSGAPAASSPWSVRALRVRATWCGDGLIEHLRDLAAAYAQHPTDGQKAYEAGAQLEVSRMERAAAREAVARWSASLRSRGDRRSLAMAEYLALTHQSAEAKEQASSRLQALARSSTDPFVTALALKRPCEPGACSNIDPAQWSRLEPANVEAWLALAQATRGQSVRGVSFEYIFDRLAAEAKYSRNYAAEAYRMVLEVLPRDSSGFDLWVEVPTFIGSEATWAFSYSRDLWDACRGSGKSGSPRAQQCTAIAEAMWNEGNWIARHQALRLVSEALPKGAAGRAVWESRAWRYQAMSAFQRQPHDWSGGAFEPKENPAAMCQAMSEARRRMMERFQLDDWGRMEADFKAAGAKIDEWAPKWSADGRKSALEPVPDRARP